MAVSAPPGTWSRNCRKHFRTNRQRSHPGLRSRCWSEVDARARRPAGVQVGRAMPSHVVAVALACVRRRLRGDACGGAEMLEFDVVVLGTGAAGLTAAISAYEGGARVGLFEKAETVGGTSAWSGGQLWIHNNPHQL